MGNVTSDLIETAIQSTDNDSDSLAHATDPAKLELYRVLRERMSDGDTNQNNTTVATNSKSSGDAADVAPVLPREPAMMAPKKKFLIGYRGASDDKPTSEQAAGSSANPVTDAVKVSPTALSTLAEVARSRSHTVSLPFRTRGPPQPEAPRRPLVESKPVETVSSAVTIRSCIMAAIDSRIGTPMGAGSHISTSAARPRPHPVANEMLPSPVENFCVDKRMMPPQHQQRTASIVSVAGSSYSPRGTQQYQRDSAGVLEPSGRTQHARDRLTVLPDLSGRMAESAGRQISESHVLGVRHGAAVVTHPGMERPVDRRILPPCATDRPPPQVVDRRFAIPPEYWKEVATDDWREASHQVPDRSEVRLAAAGHEAYVPSPASRLVDPDITVTDRVAQHYIPADTRPPVPPDQSTGRCSEFTRGWAVQHLPTDSYRHAGSGTVELPSRERRAARSHYDLNVRKYPASDVRMSAADYGIPVASELQYERRQPPEAVLIQPVGVPEAENHYRRLGPHPAPLQPVEPSVRPRIAGLTHGDPAAAYEAALPQAESSRYAGEHVYRGGRYDVAYRSRPISDVLTPPDPKQARRCSPYHSVPGATRSLSRTPGSMSGAGSSSGSFRGESVPRVTSECPLDLTVRKEHSMTAEAFLRRCHDTSQLSSQYVSPGRHATELQYSSFPSQRWTSTNNEGLESSVDVRRRTAAGAFIPAEPSSYPGHVVHRAGDVRQVHSAVRGYTAHPESDVRGLQTTAYPPHRRADDEDVHVMYARRDVDPRWETSRPQAPCMTASPVVRPTYWDGRYVTRPNAELSESVADCRTQQHGTAAASYVGDVILMSDRSQYDARLAKTNDTEVTAMSADSRGAELPVALSPQSLPAATANRRIPMVQLLGGKYSPNDILYLCCRVCGSKYGSLRSFRMHFAKVHGQEPTPENFTIQTISDARIQAMSQQARETTVGDDVPPTLQMESTDVPMSAVDKRAEFGAAKPRSVAEVQPMQKKSSPVVVVDQGPPTPVRKPSPEEATKRTGEDRRMKCKKCGQFLTHDLSALRQHERSRHGGEPSISWSGTCSCDVAVDSDTGCAACLEGFNDVTDWQHHVTSQHMMRSCVCKSCDVGFTNASALRRHLVATHGGTHSPTGSSVEVEYRCLFCREVFTDELSLYTHTRAHEQHYSTQRACSRTLASGRGSMQTRVQTAIPDTTCPEDQKSSAADVTSLDTAAVVESETARKLFQSEKLIQSEVAKKNLEVTEQSDVALKKYSKKASILRRLSAGRLPICN